MPSATWYERLSPLDTMFLDLEDGNAHMHVGGVLLFEGRPPAYRELVAHLASRLDRVPRYRRRLAFVPLGAGRPVWIDDPAFDVERHLRRATLPAPGGADALKEHAARFFSRPLDRARPLWELELVDGLGGDRFALLSKTHHCLLDGIGGVDFLAAITDADPSVGPPDALTAWTPRAAPGAAALLAASLRDDVARPLGLARGALEAGTEGRRIALDLAAGARPLAGLAGLGRAPASSLNRPIGPRRRWEMPSVELAAVKQVRAALGVTVNDVVLGVVGGALRTLLRSRGEALRDDLRVFVPVNVRPPEAQGTYGNQVSLVFCPLPLREPDPVARLRRIADAMAALKARREAAGMLAFQRLGEVTAPAVCAATMRLLVAMRYFNLVVSNIPGPQVPRYTLGRRLVACHPLIPLSNGATLSVGVLSCAGSIDVGLLGCEDGARDLPLLAGAIPDALGELVDRTRARAAVAPGAAVAAPLPDPSAVAAARAAAAPPQAPGP